MEFTVGGGGGSFYGASTWVNCYDPATGLAVGVAYSQYNGSGLGSYYGYYPSASGAVRTVAMESSVPRLDMMPARGGFSGGRGGRH